MTEILAKSKPRETIDEHTNNLLKSFESLKNNNRIGVPREYFPFIEKIFLYHDKGKANIPFQNRLRKQLKMGPLAKTALEYYPHEWLSLSFITKEDRAFFRSYNNKVAEIDFLKLFRYVIAFHHNRNFEPDDEKIKNQLEEIIKYKNFLHVHELNEFTGIAQLKHIIESIEYSSFYFFYVVLFKGILHKCDYSASAGIKAELPYIGNYQEHFEKNLSFDISILSEQQIEAKSLSDKSIIYVASTGTGKTEYSMNWINGNKAFYLLGIRTAVNAMYKRFKKIFASSKDNKENVSLLHGESIYHLLDERENNDYEEDDIFKSYNSIRLLSHPITVATADQLVTSVFKFPGFEFFYFTASYSKIVVDEIQSFSPEAIASIVVFLQEIQKLGGKFLLMTATLPPFVREEFKDKIEDQEIIERSFFSEKQRHVIEIVDETFYDNKTRELISKGLADNKKILIIVNTVSNAQRLYDHLKKYKPNLLHARFIRNDRNEKETAIINETDIEMYPDKQGKPALWISTQIVEASLDIDFDLLLTENATIDALFQRFGRCWRKREYKLTEPNIYIFEPENKKITCKIYDKEITEKTWEVLKKYSRKLIAEGTKQKIIDDIFLNIEDTDYFKKYKGYKDLLKLGLRTENKKEAEDYFRKIINNYNVIPEPIFDNNKERIENLLKIIEDKDKKPEERFKAKKELYGFTVPVQVFDKKQNLLSELPVSSRNNKKSGIWLLKGVNYSQEKGVEFIDEYIDKSNIID